MRGGRKKVARDGSLHSLAESLGQSSITCVGMWVGVDARAAVIYGVEFPRAYVSGRFVALAHRVAVAQVPMEHPAMAETAFLLPGLGAIKGRLTRIDQSPAKIEQNCCMSVGSTKEFLPAT